MSARAGFDKVSGSATHWEAIAEAGFPVGSQVFSSPPTFTMEDMKASAFDSRFSDPNTVPVRVDEDETVQVAVTLLRTIFAVDETGEDYANKPTAHFEYPDWYFEGWIVEEGSTYAHPKRRVRVYVYSNGTGEEPTLLAEMIAQIIPAKLLD